MRKILYSPGYGAGWSTWNSGEVAAYMLEYQPIIKALENDQQIDELLVQLQKECKEKFNVDYVCILGADNLRVATVKGRVRIHEYAGYESIEEEDSYEGWM